MKKTTPKPVRKTDVSRTRDRAADREILDSARAMDLAVKRSVVALRKADLAGVIAWTCLQDPAAWRVLLAALFPMFSDPDMGKVLRGLASKEPHKVTTLGDYLGKYTDKLQREIAKGGRS